MQELHGRFSRTAGPSCRRFLSTTRNGNYRDIRRRHDYLMLMAYDEHWAGKTAGSVASQIGLKALWPTHAR